MSKVIKKNILFTKQRSLYKHWSNALDGEQLNINIEEFDTLLKFIQKDDSHICLLFDELSVHDIHSALTQLQHYLHVTVLLFHNSPDVRHAASLLKYGIKGYENSFIAKENLQLMREKVSGGNRWLFSELTQYVINNFIDSANKSEPPFMQRLTQKEREVTLMIADGLTNKEIASAMKISVFTVKNHVRNIFEKAEVNDRVALALMIK